MFQQLQITSILPTTLLNLLLIPTTTSSNIQYNSLLPSILGIYSKIIYQNIKVLTKKQTELLLTNLSNNLLNWFYHEIWFQQNSFQHQWKIAHNITPKVKRNKLSLLPFTNQTNTQKLYIQPLDPHYAIEKWYLQGFSLITSFL